MKAKHPLAEQKKFHSSWLIAWASVGLLLGAVSSLAITGFASIEWLIAGLCLLPVGLRKNGHLGLTLVVMAGLLMGLQRGGSELTSQAGYSQLFGENVQVQGVVSEDPSFGVDGSMRLRLESVSIENTAFGGALWVSLTEAPSIKRSDNVTIAGTLQEGFGTIPAALYRARVLVVERPDYADVARDVRDSFSEGIRTAISEPEASLGAGFLVGQKSALPEKLDQELRLLGLTHIVVASGYNLTILIRFSRKIFAKISRFSALALSNGLVYSFALITGFSPSMSRASLIAFLSLLAWFYGRTFHPLVLLSFSAAVTVFINPSYAWGDIGWLLSFCSFIGVLILAPLLQAYFWGAQSPNALLRICVETLSAQLLTLPIIAFVFAQYSPLSLLANVLVLPVIPFAMLGTFLAGVAGLLHPTVAQLIGFPAELLLSYITWIIDRLSQWPLATAELQFSLTGVVAMYCGIVALMVFLQKRTDFELRKTNVVV